MEVCTTTRRSTHHGLKLFFSLLWTLYQVGSLRLWIINANTLESSRYATAIFAGLQSLYYFLCLSLLWGLSWCSYSCLLRSDLVDNLGMVLIATTKLASVVLYFSGIVILQVLLFRTAVRGIYVPDMVLLLEGWEVVPLLIRLLLLFVIVVTLLPAQRRPKSFYKFTHI